LTKRYKLIVGNKIIEAQQKMVGQVCNDDDSCPLDLWCRKRGHRGRTHHYHPIQLGGEEKKTNRHDLVVWSYYVYTVISQQAHRDGWSCARWDRQVKDNITTTTSLAQMVQTFHQTTVCYVHRPDELRANKKQILSSRYGEICRLNTAHAIDLLQPAKTAIFPADFFYCTKQTGQSPNSNLIIFTHCIPEVSCSWLSFYA
jgi:hypothetical protein